MLGTVDKNVQLFDGQPAGQPSGMESDENGKFSLPAEDRPLFVVASGNPGYAEIPWTQLLRESEGVGAALQSRGIGTGSHVALLGPTTRALVTAIEAVWLAGANVVVLPLPMRLGSLDEFVAQTRARIRAADVDLLLADADLAAFIEPSDDDPPLVLLTELDGDPDAFKTPEIAPDALDPEPEP